MQKIAFVLVLSCAVSRPVPAQAVDALRQGVRIEVVPIQGKSQTGTFLSLRNDSLFYESDGSAGAVDATTGATWLALTAIKSIRVRRAQNSRNNAISGEIVGSALGTIIGAVAGLFIGGQYANSPVTGWTVGAVAGGGLGFLGGSRYDAKRGDDRWESVDLPTR